MKYLIIAAMGLALASGGAACAQDAVDFRGATLGMTLDAWRSGPMPKQLMEEAAPVCSNDSDEPSYLAEEKPDRDDVAAGVVICTYGFPAGYGFIGQQVGPAEAFKVLYRFYQNRLFEIRITAHVEAAPTFLSSLKDRFGAPTASSKRKVYSYISETTTWDRPDASIVVRSPSPQENWMEVVYSDKAVAQTVAAQAKAGAGADKL